MSGLTAGTMRVRATVAYDGTDYSGFQRQASGQAQTTGGARSAGGSGQAPGGFVPRLRPEASSRGASGEPQPDPSARGAQPEGLSPRGTIQAALEAALERVTQTATRIVAAGRTDAGVHAQGQVIAFNTEWRHPLSDLQRAMNATLPRDIAVRDIAQVPPGFHPRYDALSRRYRYTIYNGPVRDPLARRTSLHVVEPLDLEAIKSVTPVLLGEHDFAAFGRPTRGEVTVRNVIEAHWDSLPFDPYGPPTGPAGCLDHTLAHAMGPRGWGAYGWLRDASQGLGTRDENERDSAPTGSFAQAQWLWFEIEANAFLFRMVRSIVGTLVQIGRGRLPARELAPILASGDRSQAGPTAPAHGLCLVHVRY